MGRSEDGSCCRNVGHSVVRSGLFLFSPNPRAWMIEIERSI